MTSRGRLADKTAIVVGAGQIVAPGQLLGYSGEANGLPHLHLAERNTAGLEQSGLVQTGHWYDFVRAAPADPAGGVLAVS